MTEADIKLAETLEQLREKVQQDPDVIKLIETHLQNYESRKKKVITGVLTYQGRPVLEVLDEMLNAKSQAEEYVPQKVIRNIQLSPLEKKIARTGYLLRRTKNSRIWWKLASRYNELCEHYDFCWDRKEVQRFREMWEAGISLKEIAAELGRHINEVFILALDQSENGKVESRPGGVFGKSA